MLSDLSDGPCLANLNGHKPHEPGGRRYNRLGGRPGLTVDFKAVCDAVIEARNGSGETMTDIAARFEVSRGWIHKWVYPRLRNYTQDALVKSSGKEQIR
jgi:hypothetical protein